MSTGRPHHLLQVSKRSLQPLDLYTSLYDLINLYRRRSETENPQGQNFDVNRNFLSLQATSLKKISLKSDLILYNCFHDLYMYIAPGQELTSPWGQNLMSTGTSCHYDHLLQDSKISLKSDFIQFVS